MGNALLDQNIKQDPVQIYEQWIEQNPDLVSRQVLTHNKLFETNFFKYAQSSIKMSVFFRRDNTPIQEYLKAFQTIQSLVERHKCMHILPMRILELKQFKDKELQKYEQNFTIAIRQYLHMTLEQRLQSRPCLSEQQKIWIIYQMIFAVYTIHEVFNIYHGNLRTSNFLLTTYHYLILTDFASYKPNYILQDTEQGLSEFRLYYASSVDKCNLAPQKMAGRDNLPSSVLHSKQLFHSDTSPETDRQSFRTSNDHHRKPKKNTLDEDSDAQQQINKLKMMDMFSLGLIILEVINDGRPSLNYEELLKLKKQGLNLEDKINSALNTLSKNKQVLSDLLQGLLHQVPEQRLTITRALQKYVNVLPLDTNALFWCCLSAFNKTSFSNCDLRIHLIHSILHFIEQHLRQSNHKFTHKPPICLNGFSSLKIFVEMIQKKLIFSPKVDNSVLFDQLLRHFEETQHSHASEPLQQEILFEDEDERRKFFINPAKKGKIAKRLSFNQEVRPKDKQLCPPNYSQLEYLLQTPYVPTKLTQLPRTPQRLEQLLQQCKQNQYLRQQRLQRPKYYKNSELIVRIIFSCIRNCKYVASKLLAIEMISFMARDCSDQILLKVLLPYCTHLTQDSDLTVCQQAFFSLLCLFQNFLDPFHCEEDLHYYENILEFFINTIKTKQSRLRFTLFSHFKEVYSICEWLELHHRRFHKTPKIPLTKIIETVKANYGYYSRDEIKVLLNNNIPEHLLGHMFEFYISLINTDRLEGLKLSLNLAKNIATVSIEKHIMEALDSCIESGLDQYGIGLFYSIQYFTLRKNATPYIIRKIAPHVINPSKWIRDQATNYLKMCLQQYPPTKNYFFFKDIYEPPFPLQPQDIDDEILLPSPLKDNDIDLKQKKLKIQPNTLTELLFNDYLKTIKLPKPHSQKQREQQLTLWTQSLKHLTDQSPSKSLHFQTYIKRQLQLLYEYNLLYYILNMNTKYQSNDKDKKYLQLQLAFKKINRHSLDLNALDHTKKELFEQLEGTINSSFEKLLDKKNRENAEVAADKLKLAQSILITGEVLCKFEMFKIKPIPKLGCYLRAPTCPQKLAKPRGTLISQIFEHCDTITCLQKVADQFFLSGSADGFLKLFDSKKILNNITTSSEASLQIKGDSAEDKTKINSICAFENTYTAVVGSNKGHIRVYPIDRLSQQKYTKQDEIIKYSVNGELEKIITFNNSLKNQCFCYITAEGNLGIQDIRLKSKSMGCNIGRERGLPRSLCSTSTHSILVGTIDGYLITFDIRYNIISSVLQLHNDRQTLPITNIYSCPLTLDQKDPLFALTYPSKHYEFSYFNIYQNKTEFPPEKQFISNCVDQIITTPYLINRTSEQQFKLSRNSLIWRKTYDELSDFHKNFNIFNYLSDPLTRKETKVRELWMDNCKHRYNQISSIYHKKTVPFLEYLPSGILTNCNPSHHSSRQPRPPFTLLTDKRENKDYNDIERTLNYKPPPFHKVVNFPGEENQDYYTCCKVLPNLIVLGCRNSLLKIYV